MRSPEKLEDFLQVETWCSKNMSYSTPAVERTNISAVFGYILESKRRKWLQVPLQSLQNQVWNIDARGSLLKIQRATIVYTELSLHYLLYAKNQFLSFFFFFFF